MTISLHDDLTNIHCADPFARNMLSVLLSQPLSELIRNVQTELKILQVDDVLLPLTITDYQPDNSYVCSPFNQYFLYGLEEIELLDNPFLVSFLRGLIAPIKAVYGAGGFDKAVMLNNWLLSTNLWQKMTSGQIQAIVDFLQEQFPDRAILFRSVDEHSNPDLYAGLVDAGCEMLFSRKVYFKDMALAEKKRDVKKDMKLYQASDYELVGGNDFQAYDFARIAELYHMLYIERYSAQNPQFTAKYLCEMWGRGLMQFRGFRKDARLDAVLAYYVRDGIMTQPIFGYDTSLPQETGLYRLLSTQVLLEGKSTGNCIHNSAGVGQFKRSRGAFPVTEYNAVYTTHLPYRRRVLWQTLTYLMNKIALPVIDKYGF